MKKARIVLVVCAFFLAFLAAGLFFLYENLKHLEARRATIIQLAKTALNRDVEYEDAKFSLWTGPTFTFRKMVIRERDGGAAFMSVDRLSVKIAILPLLKSELVIRHLQLFQPQVNIRRDAGGTWNMGDLLESEQGFPVDVRRVTIKDGRIALQDRFVKPEVVNLAFQNFDMTWRNTGEARQAHVDLKTALMQSGQAGRIEAVGDVALPAPGGSWSKTPFALRFRVRDVDAVACAPYYRRHIPFTIARAAMHGEITFTGNLSAFTSSGAITVKGMRLDYPSVFASALAPAQVRIDYDLQRDDEHVSMRKIDVSVDDFRARGSVSIKEFKTGDPALEIRVKTEAFSLEEYRAYIPYGLLPKKAAAYIRDHIRAGRFSLSDASLVGRLSQVRNLYAGDNARILQARLSVQQGVVTYGAAAPLFHGIQGELRFQGPDFTLQGMSGYFGDSPLSLEGAIRNDSVDGPSTYPFRMVMQVGEKEMAWLVGQEWMKGARITGRSLWKLSGDGPLDRYTLTGEGDLTSAAYGYGPLRKASGLANHVKFSADIRKDAVAVRSWQWNTPSIALAGAGRYAFRDRDQVALSFRSNVFDLKRLASLFPAVGKYGLAGQARVQMQASGSPKAGNDLQWQGEMALEGASVSSLGGLKPLHHIRGVIRLSDRMVATSGLSVGIGSAQLLFHGQIRDLKHPVVEATMTTRFLDLAEVGLVDAGGLAQFQDFNGEFTARQALPEGDWPVRAVIKAAQARIGGWDVANLYAEMAPQGRKLDIRAFHFNAMEGTFSGGGSADWTDLRQPAFDIDFRMAAVPATSLMKAMDWAPQKISGRVSAKGRIRARGIKKEEIVKTLDGKVTVEIEKGVLKELPVLSKVFSLLNISQWLKFRLPDMRAGGMPFHMIRASLDVKDGIVSSEDCFVRSDAINIAVVGKADIIRKNMDITLGLQPLQTIDKVVSWIPVLGWVLTDHDRRLITVLFEAKGSWENPAVRSLAVQEMAKEVLNIFKRALQLPAKLITDVDEVIR